MDKVNDYEFSNSIGRLTMVISRNIGRLLEIKFEERGYDISAKHWTVIAFLQHHNRLSQKKLSELSGLNKVMINRLIDSMEKNGWMTRKISDKDRRMNHVELTKKGDLIYNELSQLAAETIETSYKGLSKKDIEAEIKNLHRISENLLEELNRRS